MADLASDTFNRADSTNIGALDGGILSGTAWSEQIGDVAIATNKVAWVSGSDAVAVVETGVADKISISAVLARNAAGSSTLVFRFVDADNYWYISTATTLALHKIIATVDTTVVSGGSANGNGASATYTIVLDGGRIDIYKAGVWLNGTTAQTQLQTATKHGFGMTNTPDASCTVDSFVIAQVLGQTTGRRRNKLYRADEVRRGSGEVTP